MESIELLFLLLHVFFYRYNRDNIQVVHQFNFKGYEKRVQQKFKVLEISITLILSKMCTFSVRSHNTL